jgi:hypothetical protein
LTRRRRRVAGIPPAPTKETASMFHKNAPHRPLVVLGMFLLAAANVGHRFWHPVTAHGADASDFVFGVLMGAAIGVLFVAIRRMRCNSHPEG